MHLTATDIQLLHRPSPCELRPWLRAQGVGEAGPGPYQEVIRRLGERHERQHVAELGLVTDLSRLPRDGQAAATIEALEVADRPICQGRLEATVALAGEGCDVVGVPDLLVPAAGGWVVREVKFARRISCQTNPAIILQVQLYGWLLERTTGTPPAGLEVLNGASEYIHVEYDGGAAALAELECLVAITASPEPPYEPVGWSKCEGCGFRPVCWSRAEANQEVALLSDVDQGLARALEADGVGTIRGLYDRFDVSTLEDYHRPWGAGTRRVGQKAARILASARAYLAGTHTVIERPRIPVHDNYVMFDLEGLPPQLDETDRVYLWGMQVFGSDPSDFVAAMAGFGPDGDREGWETFLAAADRLMAHYGDIPFVHWASYEKTKIATYINRYGDPDGIAEHVLDNLLDLLPIVRASVILPLPSNSLKAVERYVGFERTLPEGKGDWSMAQYVEAVETDDPERRAALVEDIKRYNQEDLEATWAVLDWLRNL
jgi:predicted RecB family nuclease